MDLSVYYAYLFHPDLERVPVLVQNGNKQDIYKCNNVYIGDITQKLNQNFKHQLINSETLSPEEFITNVIEGNI